MEGMTLIIRLLYSLTLFLAGWFFNFVFDIQFVSGVFAGWLMKRHEVCVGMLTTWKTAGILLTLTWV